MSSAPQEWLSELEVDERRKLVLDSLLREHHEDWSSEEGRRKLERVADELLPKPWFQLLTLQEVDALSSTPGWDWYRCLHFKEEVAFNPRDLVEDELLNALSFLVEEGHSLLASDLRRGTDHVQTKLAFLRTVASRYSFTMSYLFKRLRERGEAEEAGR